MRDILPDIERWIADGEEIALATVVRAIGSSPRPVGAKMAVTRSGRMAGSVSGGCVEGAVFEVALEVLETGRPRLVRYGISDEQAWDVGLSCGGTIDVFVEPLVKQS
ncbi:XdhC family protein [Thermomicrobium roseum]|uniref:Putative xanthine dehydrogenase accessory factor subfamily, putative n=1 Tax=Thermomicrobium roseum (strain ATCC 27502 / DSM 5159 / P-2) TaxID=309801 RepID=B9L1F2_THERP|nr:XdhC family protein [Thermomicrobium roseum]ACM04705.1 putative xanthine dehydrogenase accessory factor subfamily, putative [Thermomicrobium roseum DSM 5159]